MSMLRDSRVIVVGGDAWAVGARGTVLGAMDTDSVLVRLDEPRLGDDGKGPFSVAQFAVEDLRVAPGEAQPDNAALEQAYQWARREQDRQAAFREAQMAFRERLERALRDGAEREIRASIADFRVQGLPLHPAEGTTGWGSALCGFGYSLFQSSERLGDPGLADEAVAVLEEALLYSEKGSGTGELQVLRFLGGVLNLRGWLRADVGDHERALTVFDKLLADGYPSDADEANVGKGWAHLGRARLGDRVYSAETALRLFEAVQLTRESGGLAWAHRQAGLAEAHLLRGRLTVEALAAAKKAANDAIAFYRSRRSAYWTMPAWTERAEMVRAQLRKVRLS